MGLFLIILFLFGNKLIPPGCVCLSCDGNWQVISPHKTCYIFLFPIQLGAAFWAPWSPGRVKTPDLKKSNFFFFYLSEQAHKVKVIIIISRFKSDAQRMSVTSKGWWLWKEQENYQWVTDLRDQCRSLTTEARNSRGLCIASYPPEQYKCTFNEVSTLVSTRVF